MPWGGAAAAAANAAKPAAAAPAGATKKTYTVTTLSKDKGAEVQILLGSYAEQGTNHGRATFKKTAAIPGHPGVNVFLYFWDARDGADFSGWWFGDQIGGSQVWARNPSQATEVPSAGWLVPWDAPKAEPGLLAVAKAAASAATTGATKPGQGGVLAPPGKPETPAKAQERAEACKAKMESLDVELKKVLAEAKGALDAGDIEELKKVFPKLQEQQKTQQEEQKALATELATVRRGGLPCQAAANEILNQIKVMNTLMTSIKTTMAQVQGKIPKPKTAQEIEKEKKDGADYEENLPKIQEAVSGVKAGLEATANLATSVVDEELEAGDELNTKLEEIETAAKESGTKITDVRTKLSTQMQSARKYAPDVQKQALKEYTALQQQLTEAQKQINTYKNFKKEYTSQVTAKKAMGEFVDKFGEIELEVDKVAGMGAVKDDGASAEDVKAAEAAIKPVLQKVAMQLKMAQQKFASAAVVKDQLKDLNDRAAKAKETLESAQKVLKPKLEKLAAAQAIKTIQESVAKAEEALNKCTEMEMPFLKGIEVGPGDESNKALAACDQAATQAQGVVGQALGLAKQGLANANQFSDKDLAKENKEAITELQETVQTLQKKLADFRASTTERKTAAVVAEVTELIEAAQTKVAAYSEAASLFSQEGGLEGEALETLKEALEKSNAVESQCSTACAEARKCIQSKQQSGPKQGAAAKELGQLQTQLNTVNQEMTKTKKAVSAAVTLIKSREALAGVEEQMKELSAESEKVEKLAATAEPSDESVLEMVAATQKTQELVKVVTQAIDKATPSAVPSVKKQLAELKEQAKKVTTELEAAKKATREPRERVLSKTYLEEAKKKADEVEAAMNKVNEAELPFLKGMENLPLQEVQESIKASKEAGEAAKATIATARTFIGEKTKELGTFAGEVAKTAKEDISEVVTRITASSQDLAQFFKDVEGREKSARVQEAEQKVLDLEADVQSAIEAAKPFSEGQVDSMSEEDATAACVKFLDLDKVAHTKLGEAKTFLAKTIQEVRSVPAHAETLKPLQAKLTQLGVDLSKAKKSTSSYEQKITAKRVAEELGQLLKQMEAEKTKIDEQLAPLLEKGGEEFLVQACVRRFAEALLEHMKAKSISQDELLGKLATESAFVDFVAKMPVALEREDLVFLEGRPAAMFKQIDADSDGKISADEFKIIFCPKYACMKEITVTDAFEVDKSTTTTKLKPGEVVEATGAPKTDDAGMTRIECRLPAKDGAEGVTGWVTSKGSSGALFLKAATPYDSFAAECDKNIDVAAKALGEAMAKIKAKTAEFPKTQGPSSAKDAEVKEGSVEQFRGEASKLAQQANQIQQQVMSYKGRVKTAKMELAKKENNEKNAHILIKEQREIDELMGPATDRISLLETNKKALEDVTAPFLALKDEELKAFGTPASTLKETERLLAALVEAVDSTKTTVKEQQAKAAEIKGTLIAEARKKLGEYMGKASSAEASGGKILAQVRQQCKSIVQSMFVECSSQLRKSGSPDALYKELAGADGVIPEEALSKRLEALEGVSVKPEHAKLICHQIGAGGVGKYAFMKFLQRYYLATRATVITEELGIETTKIVRKLETGEVIELLEGPMDDEKAGLSRVKGRALRDNATGWISVKGNKGGVFLEETEKPTYVCVADIPLDNDVKGKEGEACFLKAGQVVELVEGPRKDKCVCATRAKGKALKDNAVGWVTVKSRQGKTIAEEGKFYTCTTATALTDELDVKTGKLVKKLAVGELIQALEEPQEDSGVSRLKAKTVKDDKEGWVTLKSESGASQFTENKKYYVLLEATPLQKGASSVGSETVRELEQGEAILITEGPKDESTDSSMRGRGAVLGEGTTGWFSLGPALKPWTPAYTCVKPAAIRDSLNGEEGKDIRQLAAGEVIDFLDGPKVDPTGSVKIKGSAPKDGSVGWVAVRGADGTKHLESKGERPAMPAPSAAPSPAGARPAFVRAGGGAQVQAAGRVIAKPAVQA